MGSRHKAGVWNRCKGDRRSAFTLIELLVVVAIILILAGLTFRLISLVGRRAATAKSLYVLEQTRNALEAYFVTIGTYPPPSSIEFVRVASTNHFRYMPNLPPSLGLTYYLRYFDDPHSSNWRRFSDPLITSGIDPYHMAPGGVFGPPTPYTNVVDTIVDGWGRTIHYSPNPDLSGYNVWSEGVNGVNQGGAGDDVGLQNME